MADYERYENFPETHVTITPSDSVNLPDPMVIVAGTTGTIAVVDRNNTVITYTISSAPFVLPVIAKRINSTGTTVTQVIGVY